MVPVGMSAVSIFSGTNCWNSIQLMLFKDRVEGLGWPHKTPMASRESRNFKVLFLRVRGVLDGCRNLVRGR